MRNNYNLYGFENNKNKYPFLTYLLKLLFLLVLVACLVFVIFRDTNKHTLLGKGCDGEGDTAQAVILVAIAVVLCLGWVWLTRHSWRQWRGMASVVHPAVGLGVGGALIIILVLDAIDCASG